MAGVRTRRQEHGLEPRRHGRIHAGHLHLVVEIGAVAQTAHQRCGAKPPRCFDREISKGNALQLASSSARERCTGFLQHDYPFIRRKKRRFAGMQPDRENQAIKKPRGMGHNVEMTIGDRIKGTCVKSGAWHGFLGVECRRNPKANLRVGWVQHQREGEIGRAQESVMSQRRDFSVLEKQVHQGGSYLPSMTVIFAISAIAIGAGVILALPDDPGSKPQAASATANAPETTGSTTTEVDESLCDKQAWPYIDQRCAQRVEAARGTRQVRIVTDKGNSVTVRSPEPIVEPKPKPAPQAPVVAGAEKPIGPPAAPVAESPPQAEKIAAAPQQQVAPTPQTPAPRSAPTAQAAVTPANPPAASEPTARGPSDPSANVRNAPVAPAAASTAPTTAGVDAFAEVPSKKSKSARAAEKAAKREAKRQKAIEEENGDVPGEAAATVKAAPTDGQNSRRTRNAVPDRARSAVPDEVVEAVEQAAASEARGRRGRQVVIGSPRGGGRVYVVPSDAIGGW